MDTLKYTPPIEPRSDVVAMEGYHSPQVDVKVRLNTNESPVPPPVEWQDALADEVRNISFHRYPDRTAKALRTAIAELHGVTSHNVFVANGSNEVLQTLCMTYAGAGRTVVTFEPTYALHSHIGRLSGASVVSGERDAKFSLTTDELDRVIPSANPAITFLCSPNNPTGVVDDRAIVQRALALAPGIVVVDEAYGQFAPWSALELVNETTPLVVVRTYSKTWAMAAARLGYLIGPTWLVNELEKVVLPYHLDAVKQAAGLLALRYEPQMRARADWLVAERTRLVGSLEQLDVEVWPSGANFVLFRPRSVPADEVWQRLVDRSVLVRNCNSWSRLEGCLRVTIGTEEEDNLFLNALKEALQ
jgi:histidinol-phosphate aminotransferase